MGEAFCRKIFKGVALAGAGVAIGAAVVSFSLKRVAAASRRSLNEVNADEEKRKSASGSPSTTPNNTPTSSATAQQQSSSAASAAATASSNFRGSSTSLASIKSGRRHPGASTSKSLSRHPSGASASGLSRHPSGASTSGLSRNGSSILDLHGSDIDLDGDGGSLSSMGSSGSLGSNGGSGASSLEYHPSGDQRFEELFQDLSILS